MDKTLLQKLDAELPPFWCAAWARDKARNKPYGRKAGPKIISKRSGIPYRTVQKIGTKISWAGIDIAAVSSFIEACGLRVQPKSNVIRRNEINAYLRWCSKQQYPGYPTSKYPAYRPFHHLNNFQYALFDKRAKKWLEAQGRNS